MLKLILLVFTPLLSLFVFTLGSGLLTTLLTVRLHAEGGGPWIVGIITAVYYAGLVLGAYSIGNLIRRVGHIRVYAAFASILAVSVILQGIYVNNISWLILRFVIGFATAGLYIAIESWLLVIAPEKMRGRVLSLYMISFYAALAGGQFLLNVSSPNTIIPFCIIAMLCSLSIVPLSMTNATSPSVEDTAALSLRKLYRVSPSGFVGCLAAGMMTSVIYGLMPLFVKQLGFSTSYVAAVMGLTIFGAMFMQYPIGRLSDHIARRKVLIAISFLSLVLSCALMVFAYRGQAMFLVFTFIFGGVSFTLYPISITHTCDYLEGSDIIAATQGLLLANGVGSILGPLLVPELIKVIGPLGLFVYFAVIAALLGCYFSWRRTQKTATPVAEQHDYVSVPRNSPVTAELNPQAEE